MRRLIMIYLYQRLEWPNFSWNIDEVNQLLLPFKYRQGRLLGKMENLGFLDQEQAVLETMTEEIIKTSEIEGEVLNGDEVRSSIARYLGLEISGLLPSDRKIDGIVEMLLDATKKYDEPLTEERLCSWHGLLFPNSVSGMQIIMRGMFRTDSAGPMQVVSGYYGREKIHYQAPSAIYLEEEMRQFLAWFNDPNESLDPIIKAAIAHLWFVTIHPFDDGNGRITRAITEMALARAEKQANRFYSMSRQIRKQRKSYYDELEKTQKGSLNINSWICWFINCLDQAVKQADHLLSHILNKSKFWKQHSSTVLNARQKTMLNTLFDGIKGNLTSSKWAKMMKCSQDTAARDINQLIELGILMKGEGGGRSTQYILKDYPIHFTE